MINEIVSIILKNNIEDKEAILSFVNTEGKYENELIELLDSIFEEELSDSELMLLDKTISDQLRYSAIMERTDLLSDKLMNLKAENYDSLDGIIGELEEEFDGINKDIKSARESIENAKKDMSLSSNGFVTILDGLIQKERNPASKVKSGIQYLNAMLNGGYEKGRLYCACGPAKGWKSGFLLNMAINAKRYNQFVTNEPNMKPVIVYLSLENTNEETLMRVWNHCFGDADSIANYDKVDAARMLEKAGIFTPNNPLAPELQIWFRPNRSIDARDIAAMLEDLKKDGKECVFLVVDYLRRLKGAEKNKDLRLELSNITNELKTLAMEFNVPVLTATQLNREAFKVLDEAETFDEKLRASDKLGAANIGESIDIVQNADYAFIVNQMFRRQLNDDGDVEYTDHYLYIKLIASRAKQPAITSFKHRFKDNNGMALIEDINMSRPVSTSTDTEFIKQRNEQNGQKTRGPRSIG